MAIQRLIVWDEIDEFLVSTPTPQQIIAFHPSEKAQARLRQLLDMSRDGKLGVDEAHELEESMAVENFMRRLKVKALAKVQS
jgi:hypothetical protein